MSAILLTYVVVTMTVMGLVVCWMIYDDMTNPNSREALVIWQRMAQCAAVGAIITLVIHGV